MKTNTIISKVVKKAKSGQFVGFDYTKDSGEKSRRVVRFGVKISDKMKREGKPVSGKGNWHKGLDSGFRGCIIRRGSDRYVRGTDTKDGKLKIFKVSGISNVQ